MTDTVPSAPEGLDRRTSVFDSVGNGMQAVGIWYEKVFAAYGRIVYDHSVLILAIALAVYIGLGFGLLVAEEDLEISELWVEEGTRLRDERDLFDARFGGLPRWEMVAISKNNGGTIATVKAVEGIIQVLTPMLQEDEARYNAAAANANALKLPYTFNGVQRDLQIGDVCESAAVPTVLGKRDGSSIARPSLSVTLETTWNSSAPNFISVATWMGLPHVTQALVEWSNFGYNTMNNLQGSLTPKCLPLNMIYSDAWIAGRKFRTPYQVYQDSDNVTVTRFPCTRPGVVDCFQEGNFDYPFHLKRLDGLGLVQSLLVKFLGEGIPINPADPTNITAAAATSRFIGALKLIFQGILVGGGCSPTNYTADELNLAFGSLALQAGGFGSTLYANAVAAARWCANDAQCSTVTGVDNNNTADGLSGLYNLQGGFAVSFWAGAGYAYRTSISRLPTTALVEAHVRAGASNSGNLSVEAADCVGGAPCCNYWSSTRQVSQLWLGGKTDTSLGAFRVVLQNFASGHPIWTKRMNALYNGASFTKDDLDDVADAYDDMFINYLTPIWEATGDFAPGALYSDYKIDFLMWKSTADVVKEGSKPESALIIAGYAILIVYACFSLSRVDGKANFMVYSRMMVVVWGIFTVALATVTGFGLTAIIGWKLTPISTNLVPFLALGIGVDDMFVIAHTTVFHAHIKNPRDRMIASMGVAGPSVLLTSVTNSVAFFLAVITPIPAISTFVLQMGITTLLTITALLTIFVPILVWDSKRVAAGNPECCWVCCKPDHVPEESTSEGQRHGFINKCTRDYYVPCMKSLPGKIVVLVVFTTVFAVLTYLAFTQNETGLRLSDITLRDSYQQEYARLQEDLYTGISNSLVTRSATSNFSAPLPSCTTTACKEFVMYQIFSNIQPSEYLAPGYDIAGFGWTSGFNKLATGNASNLVPPGAFNAAFEAWITTTGATNLLDMYCENANTGALVQCSDFDQNAHYLEAAKITVFNDGLSNHEAYVNTIRDNRARVDAVDPENSFMYGWMYQYWEQYLNVEDNLYMVMGLSLAGVMAAVIVFQCSVLSSLIVTLFILIIDLEVYGAMSFLGVKINAFSVVNLVMTVGMAVEFTAHISHVFLLAPGHRNQRMGAALEEMMAPMLSGFLSSFLAVIPLAFAKFPFFRKYYFGMFAMMIFLAFVNGMIFMPVVLSLIGPGARTATGGFYKPADSMNIQMSQTNEI